MRRGLIVGNGKRKHDILLSSIIRYLIQFFNADPLEIELCPVLNFNGKVIEPDIRWKDYIIEAETNRQNIKEKAKKYFELNPNLKLIFIVEGDINFLVMEEFPNIVAIFCFNEKQELIRRYIRNGEWIEVYKVDIFKIRSVVPQSESLQKQLEN
jgi:hypothetical protein